MSTLKVNTIQNIGGTDLLAPLQSGSAKAWVNFDGTGTVAIKDSFNVTSITDNGNGDYFVTFTNAMSDKNYAVVLGHNHQDSNTRIVGTTGDAAHTDSDYITTGFRVTIETADSSFGAGRSNANRICAAVFGD